jgi:hypothetical protein
MTTPKNSTDSQNHYAHTENNTSSTQPDEPDPSVYDFINLYNVRAPFLTERFIKKVKDGNSKALAELKKHKLPPTLMDLRLEFAKCLDANVPDEFIFVMKDRMLYSMEELKRLVPEWSSIAEKALIESDPVLADKLMTPVQWNAKSAFEVTFVSAQNELRHIRKHKPSVDNSDHYIKWVIIPLEKAIEQVVAVKPPGNSLIGYGDRISLDEAMIIAKKLNEEFHKVLARNKSGL